MIGLQYYTCRNACGVLLGAMASVFGQLDASPGQDYRALSISIDPQEGPADAMEAKRIALASIARPYPADAWVFLTGDEFDHPLVLVMLSPKGKIVRYMYGESYLPVDLRMAILEASSGTIGPTIGKVLRFCFRYDPRVNQYVFNVLKVTAVVTLTFAAGLVLFLLLSRRKRATGDPADE